MMMIFTIQICPQKEQHCPFSKISHRSCWMLRNVLRLCTSLVLLLAFLNQSVHATSTEDELVSMQQISDGKGSEASSSRKTSTIPSLPQLPLLATSQVPTLRVRRNQAHRQEQQVLVRGAPPMNNSATIQGVRPFKSLSCNAEILKRTGAPPCTTTWTSLFGSADTFYNRIVVPCGTCVVLNANDINRGSKKLTLFGGIDIQGKLVIPDNDQSLNITTTHIIVQGELSISATKPITGVPTIRIRMIGTDNSISFTPIDVNARACNGQPTCTAGKKSIIVAGGRLTLNGVPNFTPTWTRLQDARGGTSPATNPDTIVVPKSTVNRWNVGSEIVITSHTHNWNTHQVRTITQRTSIGMENFVGYKLNSPIVRPTTTLESPDFAVEVALLSRNIIFEGATDDPNQRHGGHLLIFHTPSIVQRIVGVEFRNFGQQGVLGRYPIHFHHCHDVPGSIVSKNSIRQSKQRCVSVHGSNNLLVEDNVSYDTKGHCYYTEDGTETGNQFLRNIGIQTGPVDVLIPSSTSANNGIESDNEPATFWITNPSNSWIGNVAAGSQNSGFWFDPKLRGPKAFMYDTRFYKADTIQLITFKNNAAHSISTFRTAPNTPNSIAFRMYTPGYLPTALATFEGVRSFKNAVGINIHTCHRLLLTNSIFADNYRAIDLERSEDLRVTNTIVIGESESYKRLMARENVGKVCLRQKMNGIRLGTWQNKMGPGYSLTNVTFTGYKDASCLSPTMISYSDVTLKQGLFETMSTFSNVKLGAGETPMINMCLINEGPFDMLYINDLNGNFHPTNRATGVTGTLVASDNNALLRFVTPISKCTAVSSGCYSYCRDTCFRSLRVEVTGPSQASLRLKVCVRGVTPQICVFYKGGRRADIGPHTIMAHVPVGQLYDAWIVNPLGQTVQPTQQIAYFEENQCGTSRRFGIALSGQVGTIPTTPWTK